MLSAQTIAVVKATVPVLAEHGFAITQHFYRRMFRDNPELKNVFNQAHQVGGEQPRALANAVYAFAANIEQPEVLAAAISRIAHKHASLNIKPDQYAIVGHHLLASLREVLGEAATDDVIKAWGEAYGLLADVLINAEAELYDQAKAQKGGWQDWRAFTVRRKVAESAEITSFYLYPADGGPAPSFKPGQYISVKMFVPALGLIQPRQYSLSDTPNGEYLRISVKREAAGTDNPAGMVSNLLHDGVQEGDQLELSPPFGDFVLHQDRETPVVLVSGGVGITPMIGMLNSIAAGGTRQAVFVHGARDSRVQAFKSHVARLVADYPALSSVTFLDAVGDGDRQGVDYDLTGPVSLAAARDKVLLADADYYLCGPLPFIRRQRDELLEMGVGRDRIHYELFGSDVLGG